MSGVYLSKDKKHNARISCRGKMVHLGSFPTSGQAARAYDVACFILGRPMSKYNNPDIAIEAADVHKTVSLLHSKGCLDGDIAELKSKHDDIRAYAIILLAEAIKHDR